MYGDLVWEVVHMVLPSMNVNSLNPGKYALIGRELYRTVKCRVFSLGIIWAFLVPC